MSQDFETTNKDLAAIREWIAKMPHIVQDYDDYFLSALFRASKGRLSKTKAMLETMNGLGHRFPKIFAHLDPINKKTQAYLNATFIFPLPKKLEDGSLIFVFAPKSDPDINLTDFDNHEFFRILNISYFVVLWEKMEGNTKVVFIFDFSGAKLARIKDLTPKFCLDCVQLANADVPVRLQAIHIVNIPSFMESIVNFVKSMKKTKILERLHFHSTPDSLHAHIPRHYLPERFGGSEMNFLELNDEWRKKIESYRDKLVEESNKMRKLDPLRPKSEDKDQELHGTFRQLVID